MFVFISFGVWVVAFGDGMGGVSSPPPVPSALGATQMFALWAKYTPYSPSASPQFLGFASALGVTQMFALWAKCTPYSASASPQFLRQWGCPDVRPLG